jgi:ribulose-phosphate 3-epimerase
MSVNPGFGGQSFIESSTAKIARLSAMLREIGSDADIEVDGGIFAGNVEKVVAAGANVLVSGTGIFGQPDYRVAISEMRQNALNIQHASH